MACTNKYTHINLKVISCIRRRPGSDFSVTVRREDDEVNLWTSAGEVDSDLEHCEEVKVSADLRRWDPEAERFLDTHVAAPRPGPPDNTPQCV